MEDLEREREGDEGLLLRSQRGRRCAADRRLSTFPHCLTATSHVRLKVFIIIFIPIFAADCDLSKSSYSDPGSPPREFTVSLSSSHSHTPLTPPTGSGGGPWSAGRNPAVLYKPLLRSSDRLDQHVGLNPAHPHPATQVFLQDVFAVSAYWLFTLANLCPLGHCPRERRYSNHSCRYGHYGSRCWFRRNNSCPRPFERHSGWYSPYSPVLDHSPCVVFCCCILWVRVSFPLIPLHL